MEKPPAPAAPDWTKLAREIHCPLCGYNLRGLSHPRCPECGHQFVWAELLVEHEHRHPYLFEHYPRKKFRSFFRTLAASMLPRRFWRTLQPIHPIYPRRLLMYWQIITAIVVLAAMPIVFVPVYHFYTQRAAEIQRARMNFQRPGFREWAIRNYGSVQGYLTQAAPAPPPFWWVFQRSIGDQRLTTRLIVPAAAFQLGWPALTFASLLLYRASMRQAKIHRGHVLRCVIYSADGCLLLGPILVMVAMYNDPYLYRSFFWRWGYAIDPTIVLAAAIVFVVLTYRLAVAYRRYLRLPHAIAAVAASQLIVALALLKLFLVWSGM